MLTAQFTPYAGESFFSRTHVLVKIAWLVASLIVIWMCWEIWKLFTLLSLLYSFFIIILPNKDVKRIKYITEVVIITILTITLSQAIFYYGYYTSYPRRVRILFYIIPPNIPILSELTLNRGVAVTLDGVIYGVIVGIRAASSLLIAYIFLITTRLNEIYSVLRRARIPAKIIIFLANTIKFLSIFLEELWRITIVLKMKNEKFSVRNFPGLINITLYNLAREGIKRAKYLAFSIESRCYMDRIYISQQSYSSLASMTLVVIILFEVFLFAI